MMLASLVLVLIVELLNSSVEAAVGKLSYSNTAFRNAPRIMAAPL